MTASKNASNQAMLAVASVATLGAACIIHKALSRRTQVPMPAFLTQPAHHNVVQALATHVDQLSGDELVKIVRQLEFWIAENTLSDAELVALVERLVYAGTWRRRSFQVPKVRFGRTELAMPIITCGAMRFQHTWAPDFMSITIKPDKVLKTPSQDNICAIVRACLRAGINHFETARFYGTSEHQLTTALRSMMDSGEIQREDFIL